MSALRAKNQFVIVDSPGSDTYISRLAHAAADTLVTPINDSFVDFDLLGKVDPDTLEVLGPSIYSELVWECRKARMQADEGKIDWVVLRSRTSHVFAKNRKRVDDALDALAGRSHFRVLPGLSERVIFREMYPAGLTLLDLTEAEANTALTLSHIAARAEVFALIKALDLPGVEV
jgi:chromosome partitioning protein